jgi:hypothetical protein
MLFFFLLATDLRAWGYVDPGSGLFALQSFASVLAAAGYILRRRIATLFKRKRSVRPSSSLTHAAATSPRRDA